MFISTESSRSSMDLCIKFCNLKEKQPLASTDLCLKDKASYDTFLKKKSTEELLKLLSLANKKKSVFKTTITPATFYTSP